MHKSRNHSKQEHAAARYKSRREALEENKTSTWTVVRGAKKRRDTTRAAGSSLEVLVVLAVGSKYQCPLSVSVISVSISSQSVSFFPFTLCFLRYSVEAPAH